MSESTTHDPLCDWRPCTCPLDYDVPERGHMIGCPEDDCECEIIAKVRADQRDRDITKIQRREVTLHNLASTAYAEIVTERQVFGPEGPTMGDWLAFQKGMLYANVVIAEPEGTHSEWEPGQPLQ